MIITHTGSGRSERALTAADGSFTIARLTPGAYQIEVAVPGFNRLVQGDIVVGTLGTTTVSLVLVPGHGEETVNATGNIPVLQRESGERNQSFDTRSVRELPIVDRNYQELVRLLPGVMPPTTTSSVLIDPQRNRVFHSNGQAFNANNWNLDGARNTGPASHLSVHVPPVEAIQQMNVRNSAHAPTPPGIPLPSLAARGPGRQTATSPSPNAAGWTASGPATRPSSASRCPPLQSPSGLLPSRATANEQLP